MIVITTLISFLQFKLEDASSGNTYPPPNNTIISSAPAVIAAANLSSSSAAQRRNISNNTPRKLSSIKFSGSSFLSCNLNWFWSHHEWLFFFRQLSHRLQDLSPYPQTIQMHLLKKRRLTTPTESEILLKVIWLWPSGIQAVRIKVSFLFSFFIYIFLEVSYWFEVVLLLLWLVRERRGTKLTIVDSSGSCRIRKCFISIYVPVVFLNIGSSTFLSMELWM